MVANLVCDNLDELTYSASLAGLNYSLNHHSEGLSVCVYGYRDKLPLLLQVVLENIKNLQPRADRLEVFKEKVRFSIPAGYSELTMENYRRPVITGIFPCKSQWTTRDIMPDISSMLYNGPLRRSFPRSRVRPANRHKRENFLICHRYRRGGRASTPCKPFVSTARGDVCHRKFCGKGRKPFIPSTNA